MKKDEVTRKAQHSYREQLETPSSASVTPWGELIWNDNKEKPGWDKSQQKGSCGGKKDTWQSSRSRCSIKQQTSTTGHLSVTLRQDNREEDDRRRITPQGHGSMAWTDRWNCVQAYPVQSAESQPWTCTVRMQRRQLHQLQSVTQLGWGPCSQLFLLVFVLGPQPFSPH